MIKNSGEQSSCCRWGYGPWVLPALVVLACQRDPVAIDHAPAPGRIDAGHQVAPPPPASASAPGGRGPAPGGAAGATGSAAEPDAGTADAGPAVEGTWAETASYKFKLDDVKGCGGAAPEKATWVGFLVRVAAKVDETLVSPRDVTLEKGGVILNATYLDPPKLQGCAPLMAPKQLRASQTNRGFVLFQVPADFRTANNPMTLAYRPTRWGGAARVEVNIPPCLDACPPTLSRGPSRRAGSRTAR